MDGDHIVVDDGGGGAGLAGEALAGRAGDGQRRGQHLDGDDAPQLGIEGAKNDAGAAAADDLENLVMIQPSQRARLGRRGEEREVRRLSCFIQRRHVLDLDHRPLKKLPDLHVGLEHGVDMAAQRLIAAASAIEVGSTFRGRGLVQGGKENDLRG